MGEFSPPFFLSPLLLISLISLIEVEKIHPPFQNPGSAPATSPWKWVSAQNNYIKLLLQCYFLSRLTNYFRLNGFPSAIKRRSASETKAGQLSRAPKRSVNKITSKCWGLVIRTSNATSLICTRSTIKSGVWVWRLDFHGLSPTALSQYLILPYSPSNEVGRLWGGRGNWNGKL